MDNLAPLLLAVPAALGAGLVVGLFWRGRALLTERTQRAKAEEQAGRIPELENSLEIQRRELQSARESLVRREEQVKASQQQLKLLEEARQNLTETFKALSAETLRQNNQAFMEQAKGTFEQYQQPVRDTLEKTHKYLKDLEISREGAYKGLEQQIKLLMERSNLLQTETQGLRNALRTPTVAGRWGEVQLRRVVELSGLQEHCDFATQVTANDNSGQRPDLIVYMPSGGQVIVDAKAPIRDYLDAMDDDADEETRLKRLADYADKVRTHLRSLSNKSYWERFQPTPAFVIMYLPGEIFYHAAMREAQGLFETAAELRVLPAGPTALIALLHTIALGWRERRFEENAEQVRLQGQQLYARIQTLLGHWTDLGRNLNKAVNSYNKTTASMETRVLPSARKMNELGAVASGKELPSPDPVGTLARTSPTPPTQD